MALNRNNLPLLQLLPQNLKQLTLTLKAKSMIVAVVLTRDITMVVATQMLLLVLTAPILADTNMIDLDVAMRLLAVAVVLVVGAVRRMRPSALPKTQ